MCSSYRPISLLNIDLKLFTKILTNRLTQYMPDIVHLNQVGFIPAREARDNTTKVLNLIEVATATKTPCIFHSTEAEKVFDRVNWVFMSSVLEQIGLGHRMLQWISRIYSTPMAQVKANGILSNSFSITNSTRQGCPLSPLLFALALELFLCVLYSHTQIYREWI